MGLSGFLRIAVQAVFQVFGKRISARHAFTICFIWRARHSPPAFNTRLVILSAPGALLGERPLTVLVTSSRVNCLNILFGPGGGGARHH